MVFFYRKEEGTAPALSVRRRSVEASEASSFDGRPLLRHSSLFFLLLWRAGAHADDGLRVVLVELLAAEVDVGLLGEDLADHRRGHGVPDEAPGGVEALGGDEAEELALRVVAELEGRVVLPLEARDVALARLLVPGGERLPGSS